MKKRHRSDIGNKNYYSGLTQQYIIMTEYLDYISDGQQITITTAERILSGDVIEVGSDGFRFDASGPRSDESDIISVIHVGGSKYSTDEISEYPEYTADINGETVSVNDVRHGSYSIYGLYKK